MTAIGLRELQERIKFDAPSMAACLGVDYEQYRRYYYGHTEIPAKIERAALELEAINVVFMEERYSPGGTLDQELAVKYPFGIRSEINP